MAEQRLIDANALETHEQLEPLGNGKYEYVEIVYKDDIDMAPTIEPERKKGKWLRSGSELFPYECDQCGDTNERKTPYCPHCGAEMER